MRKQDRVYTRTPAALEQKYDWGKTFAEVYGLAQDAQKTAEKAMNAVDGLDKELDHEEIFNRLTNNGTVQGIYRSENDDIYINASYIKSGTLAAERIDADNLKVKAANITGTLTAGQIDATGIKVSAANITGKLTASQIDATNLTVSAANITGSLSANQFTMGGQMSVYQEIGSTNLAGYFGYMDVSTGGGFSGKALGIAAPNNGGHAVMLAPYGNIAIASFGDVHIGSEAGTVIMSGTDLTFNGESIYLTLLAIKTLLGLTTS